MRWVCDLCAHPCVCEYVCTHTTCGIPGLRDKGRDNSGRVWITFVCSQVYVCAHESAFLRPRVWVYIVSPRSRVSLSFSILLLSAMVVGLCSPRPPQPLPVGRRPGGWSFQGLGLWSLGVSTMLPRAGVFWIFMQDRGTPPGMGGKERKHFEGS